MLLLILLELVPGNGAVQYIQIVIQIVLRTMNCTKSWVRLGGKA